MESETHKNLVYKAGPILGKYGWAYEYTMGGVSDVDIIASQNGRIWKVEIEYSGGKHNIEADLQNGAQIFIAPWDRIQRITKQVRALRSRAPVVTIGEFEKLVRLR